MPKIDIKTERIQVRISRSKSGLHRQVTFAGLTWNEEERFLEINFRCDYGKVREEIIINEDETTSVIEVFDVINNPKLGIKSFEQKFKADDNTLVDDNGDIVKLPNLEPFVDLSQINYLTQYEYFYRISRNYGFSMALINQFIEKLNETNGWSDFD